MNLSARSDAFHDLLPQVATLVEIERLRLIRLLGEKPLADVFTVTGLAVLQPDHAGRFGISGLGSSRFETRDQRRLFGGWSEDEKPCAPGRIDPCDQRVIPVDARVLRL